MTLSNLIASLLGAGAGIGAVIIFQYIMKRKILKAKVGAINYALETMFNKKQTKKYKQLRNEYYENFVEEQTLLKK